MFCRQHGSGGTDRYQYKKNSLTDHVGAIYQTETEQLSKIANKIEKNADIPMVSEYDSLRWFADYSDMQKAMKAKSVILL